MVIASTLGIGSVVAASQRSIALSQLYKADDVRAWVSQKLDFDAGGPLRPLRSSISAQQLLTLPSSLLCLAGLAYIAGFGVYIGLVWTDDIPTISLGPGDNRNVFIFFMLSLLPLISWMFGTLFKAREQSRFKEQSRVMEEDWKTKIWKTNAPELDSPLYTMVLHQMGRVDELNALFVQPAFHLADVELVDQKHNLRTKLFGPVRTSPVLVPTTQVTGSLSFNPPSAVLSKSEQIEYFASLRLAAEARRKSANADLAVASEYSRLATNTQKGQRDHAILIDSLRKAGVASQEAAEADMTVLRRYEAMTTSTSSG
jgi:hypothetical protein